ncbi:hypothetical protein [Corallococcus exiguus]|uniref:Uncharacterized protein n=1 Tax=Corallococcus exiguus TaxID=83462 RepID=A0A7X5BRZ2_9BACT|nr:hypothetical protein [Corallococcus exiguus]NBC38717.1 hypothetical protein [Corallococcus exiguus]TNV54902.1 hypothetical protein FH620_32320 [Corallococcus exiguus]
MKRLLLVGAVLCFGCMRREASPSDSLASEDRSIVFPEMFAREALTIGAPGQPYSLEGNLLRAMVVAADDFLPRQQEGLSCWSKREAHRFRLLREGDIVFIRMDLDPRACEPGRLLLDGGVTYAVRLSDGRILRRLHDGEPDGTRAPVSPDAGVPTGPSNPSIPVGDTSWGEPQPSFPAQWLDAGSPNP